jgi:hypothetical protein
MKQYAAKKIQKATPQPKFSVCYMYVDVTLEELTAFLGIILNTASNFKTHMMDYFSAGCLDRTLFFKDVFLVRDFFSYFGCCIVFLSWQLQ